MGAEVCLLLSTVWVMEVAAAAKACLQTFANSELAYCFKRVSSSAVSQDYYTGCDHA